MSEPNILKTLRTKRDAIENIIAAYTKKIELARRDLSHVNATLRMFENPETRKQFPAYMDTLRLFKWREIANICKASLAKEGPLDTRELSVRVMKAKGFDLKDDVLRRSIAFRIVQALRLQMKRGTIQALQKRKGVRVWKI